ncbi:MAG TPA: DoxX family protein [Vicinamibacterales bacterium]
MKTRLGYLVSTALFSVMMLASALAYLTGSEQMVQAFRHLGYPDYFRLMLGMAKIAGVLALVIPQVPRLLREWAYAGFVITMVSAFMSHAASGDPLGRMAMPLVALGLVATSRALWRPVPRAARAESGAGTWDLLPASGRS